MSDYFYSLEMILRYDAPSEEAAVFAFDLDGLADEENQ